VTGYRSGPADARQIAADLDALDAAVQHFVGSAAGTDWVPVRRAVRRVLRKHYQLHFRRARRARQQDRSDASYGENEETASKTLLMAARLERFERLSRRNMGRAQAARRAAEMTLADATSPELRAARQFAERFWAENGSRASSVGRRSSADAMLVEDLMCELSRVTGKPIGYGPLDAGLAVVLACLNIFRALLALSSATMPKRRRRKSERSRYTPAQAAGLIKRARRKICPPGTGGQTDGELASATAHVSH
jgi:hypothetical protein